MTYHLNVHSNIGIDFFGFYYLLGGDFEVEGKRGTSHLMEHLVCKSFDDMLPQLKRFGINYNAFTSNSKVGFYFQGLSEKLDLVYPKLFDRITSGVPYWDRQKFENEKKIVLQEYSDDFDNPIQGFLISTFRQHYDHFGALGIKKDIEDFTYEDSLVTVQKFKVPELVCHVGKSVPPAPTTLAFPEVTFSKTAKFGNYNTYKDSYTKGAKPILVLLSRKPVPKSLKNKVNILITCLADGIESPLVQEIREKNPLAYTDFAGLDNVLGQGVIIFLAQTEKRDRKKLKAVYREFLSGDLSRHIDPERFQDCLEGLLSQKRVGELLPHEGISNIVFDDSRYTDIEDFTYEEGLALLDEYFKLENFEEIEA